MAKTTPADLFLNFVALETALDGTNTTTLVEAILNTGLSIRGALIWLVHLVEVNIPYSAAAGPEISWVLATRQGLPAMPGIADDGVIAKMSTRVRIAGTSGQAHDTQPKVLHYLPPIPIATPQLSLYCNSSQDNAGDRGEVVTGRVGFTTAPLDSAAYTEVAEAWGW